MSGKGSLVVALLLGHCLCACGSEQAEQEPASATRTLRVRIVDAEGMPAAGGVWWASDPEAEHGMPAGLGSQDEIVLEDVPAGRVVLVALPDGFVVPSEGWPRKVIPPGVTETVLVLDVGATRTLKILGWNEEWDGLAYLAAVSDLEPSQHGVEDDGAVRLVGLRPGVRYNLYVREFETGRCALLRNLSADEPWPSIELAPGREITGRVVPPAGCGLASVAVMVDRAVMMDAYLEDDGSFMIRAVPSGSWKVVAYTTLSGKYVATTVLARAGGEPVVRDLTR